MVWPHTGSVTEIGWEHLVLRPDRTAALSWQGTATGCPQPGKTTSTLSRQMAPVSVCILSAYSQRIARPHTSIRAPPTIK